MKLTTKKFLLSVFIFMGIFSFFYFGEAPFDLHTCDNYITYGLRSIDNEGYNGPFQHIGYRILVSIVGGILTLLPGTEDLFLIASVIAALHATFLIAAWLFVLIQLGYRYPAVIILTLIFVFISPAFFRLIFTGEDDSSYYGPVILFSYFLYQTFRLTGEPEPDQQAVKRNFFLFCLFLLIANFFHSLTIIFYLPLLMLHFLYVRFMNKFMVRFSIFICILLSVYIAFSLIDLLKSGEAIFSNENGQEGLILFISNYFHNLQGLSMFLTGSADFKRTIAFLLASEILLISGILHNRNSPDFKGITALLAVHFASIIMPLTFETQVDERWDMFWITYFVIIVILFKNKINVILKFGFSLLLLVQLYFAIRMFPSRLTQGYDYAEFVEIREDIKQFTMPANAEMIIFPKDYSKLDSYIRLKFLSNISVIRFFYEINGKQLIVTQQALPYGIGPENSHWAYYYDYDTLNHAKIWVHPLVAQEFKGLSLKVLEKQKKN